MNGIGWYPINMVLFGDSMEWYLIRWGGIRWDHGKEFLWYGLVGGDGLVKKSKNANLFYLMGGCHYHIHK